MVGIETCAISGERMRSVIAASLATVPCERVWTTGAVIVAPEEAGVVAGLLARPVLPEISDPSAARAIDRDQRRASKSEAYTRVIVNPTIAWKIESRCDCWDNSASVLPVAHTEASYWLPRWATKPGTQLQRNRRKRILSVRGCRDRTKPCRKNSLYSSASDIQSYPSMIGFILNYRHRADLRGKGVLNGYDIGRFNRIRPRSARRVRLRPGERSRPARSRLDLARVSNRGVSAACGQALRALGERARRSAGLSRHREIRRGDDHQHDHRAVGRGDDLGLCLVAGGVLLPDYRCVGQRIASGKRAPVLRGDCSARGR